jgi:hypothetical protein
MIDEYSLMNMINKYIYLIYNENCNINRDITSNMFNDV